MPNVAIYCIIHTLEKIFRRKSRKGKFMKRKLVAACLSVLCVAAAPMSVLAEETSILDAIETEEVTEEAVDESAETEAIIEGETTGEGTVESAGEEEVTEEASAEEEEAEEVVRPEYIASEYITLGEYKGLKVTVTVEEITDEQVNERAESELEGFENFELETLTEGTVAEGDVANIDYEGKKDGVAFEGGTAEGHDLEIGSNSFIDGFEEGLIGVEVGETVDLELTFPENYQSEDLAGQDVIFTVTVNSIQRMPELTDEVVNTATDGEYEDLESYLKEIREALEEEQKYERENAVLEEVLAQITEAAEVSEYPEGLVDYYMAENIAYNEAQLSMYGIGLEDYLTMTGMTMEDFESEVLASVEAGLPQQLALEAIAEMEEMEITEEEYGESVKNYMEMYGYTDEESFISAFGGEESLRQALLQQEVYDFLLENTEVEEILA